MTINEFYVSYILHKDQKWDLLPYLTVQEGEILGRVRNLPKSMEFMKIVKARFISLKTCIHPFSYITLS